MLKLITELYNYYMLSICNYQRKEGMVKKKGIEVYQGNKSYNPPPNPSCSIILWWCMDHEHEDWNYIINDGKVGPLEGRYGQV